MGRAGAVEGGPQIALDRPLVAHHQRHQNAGPRVIVGRQQGGERIAHAKAQALDDIVRPPDHLRQALRRILADVAGRPDVAFEQPGFVIETVRVGVAVRALQAHRQSPALAGFQRLADEFFAVALALVPRQHDPLWNHGCYGRHLFNGKFEAAALAEILRQRRDDADHLDVAPFPCGRQRIGQADVGAPRGPREAERQAGQNAQHAD